MADPEVDLVLNLTIPVAHAEVALMVITAGKPVYGEKPVAATTAAARAILGPVVAATASRVTPVQPYHRIGPGGRRGHPGRCRNARFGRAHPCDRRALHAGHGFDAVASHAARIEIHGERATLVAPDPNIFDGDVEVSHLDAIGWPTLPPSAGYRRGARGYGIADLVTTPDGLEPRAGGRLAYHVLDVMESLLASARSGRTAEVSSSCDRPALVPLGELAGG